MRTLNIRLAIILLVVVVVSAGGIYALHNYQMGRNAHMFYDAAIAAEKEAAAAAAKHDVAGEQEAIKEALKNLQWYVTLAPKDYDALEKLGLMMAAQAYEGNVLKSRREFFGAYGKLEYLVRVKPDRVKARRELVKMATLCGRFQDAKDHLEGYLLKDAPKDPELLESLGRCQAALGDYNLARESFQKAIESDSTRLTSYQGIAEVLRRKLSRPKDADKWMLKLVENNPKSTKAHLFRGHYLLTVGTNDSVGEAAAEALKASKLDSDDVDVVGLAAQCELIQASLDVAKGDRDSAMRHFDEARALIARGIKRHPGNVALHMNLSDVERNTGNRDSAIAALRAGLKATDRNPMLLFSLAQMLIDGKDFKESNEIVAELKKAQATRPIPDYWVEYLTARIAFGEGHWLPARQGFESIRGALVSDPSKAKQVALWIGQCYAAVSDYGKAEQSYRAALNIDPNFGLARAALIDLLQRLHRLDQSGDELSMLNPKNLGPGAAIPLANIIFQRTLKQAPDKRDWKPVERALDNAEKNVPGAPEIVGLRADMLLTRGRPDEAETLLLNARKKNPKELSYWSSLALLYEYQKKWEKAQAVIDEFQKQFGDIVATRLLQANYVVSRYGRDGKPQFKKIVETPDQFTKDDRVKLWEGLLNVAMRMNDVPMTSLLSDRIAKAKPDDAKSRFSQFQAAVIAEDVPAMERSLADLKKSTGESSFWLWGKAVLLEIQARDAKDPKPLLTQALGYLVKAREARGDWARIPTTAGRIHDAMGEPRLALKDYRDALDMGDRDPAVIVRIVQILFQMQRFGEADKELRSLEEQRVAFSPGLCQVAAEVALQLGDFDRALDMMRKAVAGGGDQKKYQQQLWVGQVLCIVGGRAKSDGRNKEAARLFEEAEDAMRHAVDLEPKIPAAWAGLVRCYAMAGDNEKAVKAIEDASQNLPTKEVALTIAQCYQMVGMAGSAERNYDKALAASPKDVAIVSVAAKFFVDQRNVAKAEPLLRKIIDGSVKANEKDVVWARRELAMMYAARHDYPDLKKAQELLETNRASKAATLADLQQLAVMYSRDPSRDKRREAIDIWEMVIKNQRDIPADRAALAQAYLADGNWSKAGALMRKLVSEFDKDPRYLAMYIDSLIKRGEVSDVPGYLDRLNLLAPNAFVVASLRADLLLAQKRPPQEAIDVLTKFIERSDAQPADRNERKRLVADKLTALSRQLTQSNQKFQAEQFSRAAEMYYRAFVETTTGQDLLLVAFLAEVGKVNEAMDILGQVLDRSQPFDLARACSTVVNNISDDKDKWSRVNDLLDKALKKSDRLPPLVMVMASAYARQGRFADAEKLYREVLKKSPDDGVVMNNLAVLLATQGIKLDEALKLANQAVATLGPSGAVLDSRACVYIALKDPDNAMKDITVALDDKETPVRLFHQAQALLLANQREAAKAAMTKAMRLELTKDMLEPLEANAYEQLKQLQRGG